MLIRYGVVAAVALAVGVLLGTMLPRKPAEPTRFETNSIAFHQCIAPLGSSVHKYPLSWDAESQQRAFHILVLQTDCLNMSGIDGLTISRIECASGYHFMPKADYEAGLRAHRWNPVPPFPPVGAPCM
jgi:hypothetical protein